MARSHDDGTSTYDSTTASTYDATALTYDATALTYDATASAYDCATTLTYDSATIADDAIAMGKQPDGLPIRPMFPHPYSPAPHHLALRRHPAPRHRKPDSTAQMLSQQGLKRSPQVHSAWPAHRHLAYDTSIAPAPSHHGRPYARQGGLVQPYGYTGRRFDNETQLWYFRARYFDSEIGVFISRDPLGYIDGMVMYLAYFSPNGRDPYGLTDLDSLIERGISLRDDYKPYFDIGLGTISLVSDLTGSRMSGFRIGKSTEQVFSGLSEAYECETVSETHTEIQRVMRFLGENWRLSPLHDPNQTGSLVVGDKFSSGLLDRLIGSWYQSIPYGYTHDNLITDWMSYQFRVDIFKSIRSEIRITCEDYCSVNTTAEVSYTKTTIGSRVVSCFNIGTTSSLVGGAGFEFERPHSGGGGFAAPVHAGVNVSAGRFDFSLGSGADLLDFSRSNIKTFCNIVYRP